MNNESAEAEKAYDRSLAEARRTAGGIKQADIVVGIPFRNEADTIGDICETAVRGLTLFYPHKKCVVICAGSSEGNEALSRIQEVGQRQGSQIMAFLMESELVSGTEWKLRSIIEIAALLGADLALLAPDLKSGDSKSGAEGLSPEWISSLILPIEQEGMDLVVPRFSYYYPNSTASIHLVCPLITSIFNVMIRDLPGGVFGISSRLLRTYRDDQNIWSLGIGNYDLDSFLITSAAVNEARICETGLGVRGNAANIEDETVWRYQTRQIFNQIAENRNWWHGKGDVVSSLARIGKHQDSTPAESIPDTTALVERYRRGFNEFQGLYEEILSRDTCVELRKLAGSDFEGFRFPSKLWAEIVYEFLLTYCLEREFTKDNIMNAFIPVCCGRAAGYVRELNAFRARAIHDLPDEAEHLTSLIAAEELELQTGEFIGRRKYFVEKWTEREEELRPMLPRVTYREFIPGVPLIVPRELLSLNGEVVNTDSIYRDLLERNSRAFEKFIYGQLGISRDATSTEIAQRVEELMLQVEEDLDSLLLSGDLSTVDGTTKVAESVFNNFLSSETYVLKPEVASWILQQNPPSNLLVKHGAANLDELEQRYDANEILALSSLSEETEHTVSVWDWIAGNARPEHFTYLTLKPLIVSYEDFPMLTTLKEPSSLSRLAGRIVVSNLPDSAGGKFAKLRYLTMMAKHIVEAERFGELWQQFARERKEFGTRVVNSLKGHWGGEPFSAHNIFESSVQRTFVQRLKKMSGNLAKRSDSSSIRLISNLELVVDSYHLAPTLPDGKFIPCSAWTWSSYSFKGGKGVPTPLSLHVERDWVSREFLTDLLEAHGVSEEIMDRKIVELMGQGLESQNLARLMLPGWGSVQDVMPEQLPRPAEPTAGKLHRFEGNPILKAKPEHEWEAKYIFNPGVIRLDGNVYILYRASGEDEVSRIGLAITADGFHIDERLENPIFGPEEVWEKRGCEDPRLVLIEDHIYMLYTAYDSVVAQIALASIGLEDFLNRRWDKWDRKGLVFPGFENKDATLFPQRFNGRYVIYHRIEPSIWISSCESVDCPWPREDHRILLGPGAGMSWDGLKLGGGSQPIKTRYGWLLVYHGVDTSWVYRLGVLLVALDDPGWLLYRSPNPILEPEEVYEIGEEGSYVPNVVFTCGAVPRADKEVLDDDDEILVYYGGADTVTCVASAKISELLPEEIREGRFQNGYQV